MDIIQSKAAKFGKVLGMAPGNVPVYSSDYDTADKQIFPDRKSYQSFIDGIYMGYKYQCVELARRWLYINKHYVFENIPMAYDIFRLRKVIRIPDNTELPLHSFRNGSRRKPEPGCLLIWDAEGEFEITGHVAIVTEVAENCVRFVEQNVENIIWPDGQNFSRELNVTIAEDGGYWIQPRLKGTSLLGWVIQTDDASFSDNIGDIDKNLFVPLLGQVENNGQTESPWVDTSNEAGRAYVDGFGHKLAGNPENSDTYFCLSETAFAELKRATNELHHLFLRATEYVLQDDSLLDQFNIPPFLRPALHNSWNTRKRSMLTGRFDFSISKDGLKLYEYNADSASCYYEAAILQETWANHFGCTIGRHPGEGLFEALVKAWEKRECTNLVHIMHDHDPEERYHSHFMKAAMERAGMTVKTVEGVTGLHWDKGNILDPDGVPIRRIWKTWAWETALDQIRDQSQAVYSGTSHDTSEPPHLADVLFHPEIVVNEPLWTLIPSNKAILPIMWMLFPDHPYLLQTQHDLTDDLRRSGYVEKPIVGRAGENIVIVDHEESVVRETQGRFGNHKRIYQELFPLAKIGKMNVQVCTFSVAGRFAGTCIRADTSLVIKGGSDVIPLRIIPDDEYRTLANTGRDQG